MIRFKTAAINIVGVRVKFLRDAFYFEGVPNMHS